MFIVNLFSLFRQNKFGPSLMLHFYFSSQARPSLFKEPRTHLSLVFTLPCARLYTHTLVQMETSLNKGREMELSISACYSFLLVVVLRSKRPGFVFIFSLLPTLLPIHSTQSFNQSKQWLIALLLLPSMISTLSLSPNLPQSPSSGASLPHTSSALSSKQNRQSESGKRRERLHRLVTIEMMMMMMMVR